MYTQILFLSLCPVPAAVCVLVCVLVCMAATVAAAIFV